MKIQHVLICCLAVFMGASSLGAPPSTSFNLSLGREHSLKFTLAPDWVHFENIYGVPTTILGPEKEAGKRTVINFTFTQLDVGKSLEQSEALSKEAHDYRSGRKAWIEKRGGALHKFFDLQKLQLAGSDGIKIGCAYKLGDQEFEEWSYYIQCKSVLVIGKSIYPIKNPAQEKQELDTVVRDAKCL